jgi:hypothetical protein
MKELANRMKVVSSYDSTVNDNQQPVTIDRTDYFALSFIDFIYEGVYSPTNYLSSSLEHSDDGKKWERVPITQIGGDEIKYLVNKVIKENQIRKYSYLGDKKYIRFVKSKKGTFEDNLKFFTLGILQLPIYC